MQLDPLPDPEELVAEIEKSLFEIQCCPDATHVDIPPRWLELWSIDEENLAHITDELERLSEKDLHHSTVPAIMVFSQIYLNYYRIEDFADFGNFIHTFNRFQWLLKFIRKVGAKGGALAEPLRSIRLFDLESLDSVLDLLSEKHKIKIETY